MSGRGAVFADRVLAEAVRAVEGDGVRPIADPDADRVASEIVADFEGRLVHRARHLAVAGDLRSALRQVRRATTLAVIVGLILAAAAGAGALRTALGPPGAEPANIFLVLITALGIQTLVLVIWAGLLLASPATLAGGSLGGLLLSIGGRVAGWLHRGPDHAAALRGLGSVLASSPVGRWTLSTLSHAMWTGFNAGTVLVLVLLLSTRQYTFAWQTTILSERSFVPVTRALAAGPRALGFVVPTEAQIRQSRWTGGHDMPRPQASQLDATAAAWSGLIVGSVVVYGLLPRVALLLLCATLAARARRRYRLDTDRPGFRRLHDTLCPSRRSLGRVDEDDDEPVHAADERPTAARERAAGRPAVVGFEIERPEGDWPPRVPDVRWDDLGFVDDRVGRDRVVATLRDADTEPSTLVVVADLTTTPDRGVERFLGDVQSAVRRPIRLVLTGGDRLRQRMTTDQVASRVSDWRAAAGRAGVEAASCLELDLDHATSASLGRLAALLDGEVVSPEAGRSRLVEAFDLVAVRVERWPERPEPREQAELHAAIARIYRDDVSDWRRTLRMPGRLDRDVTGQITGGARRVLEMMPPSLRLSPRWLAAGALSGALGCIAAATLISPVAIGALPVWTGLGAAVLQVARAAMPKSDDEDTAERPDLEDRATAVRSVALFALLLELQGHDEAVITRLLETTLADGDGDPDPGADTAAWLAEIRHRLDMGLAREATT